MINNELIKSIKPFNGHVLLTIYPGSRMKLSLFAFKLDKTEYGNAFYSEKGYLELHSIEAVKKFLNVNSSHLNEALRQSILEDAQLYFNNPHSNNTENRRLSFFHATQEKIPLTKLQHMSEWVKKYYPPHQLPPLMDAFNNVFSILLPAVKRKKLPNSPFFEVFELEGTIKIDSLTNVIGKAWSDFYKFQLLVHTAVNFPGNDLKKIAMNPQSLGKEWDLLNKEKFISVLEHWLQSILDTKINPVDDQELSAEELDKLQKEVKFIQDAFHELKNEPVTSTYNLSL
ncbi:hypothetical protein [Legionella drancourtii]|uniref:Uncharacterized protein n=1 Tax=Legionella drancourtii LLAP12 TaxID=658187 RepID=G9ELZ8_9GAMM|nr:hypothetical protein [Legionella drancourtii]EHL31598.1 hypothetical protein LDG_6259 [Legionella drancourtii LLAP12]